LKIVNRTSKIPIYIFSKFDEIKKSLSEKGVKVIDLGIGDPDMATPEFIVEAMCRYIRNKENHKYPPYSGIDDFKKSVAEYYYKNYNVELDYKTEVAALVGSKEGLAHLFLALGDAGDYVLIPDPAYPVYHASAIIAGCSIYKMPLTESNNYLPNIDNIYPDVAKKAKVLVVNYPNNPTGAVADSDFFEKLVGFGNKNNVVIVNDGAYIDIHSSEEKIPSLLQTPGSKNIGVEFGSLSKSFNMTGWRLGYVAGNKDVISKLIRIKTYFDSGQFAAIQQAGALALREGKETIDSLNKLYDHRRAIAVEKLQGKGLKVYESKGAFYIWFRIPSGYKTVEFVSLVLEKTGVIITPGNAFGSFGEGYCRISLTVGTKDLEEAMNRILELKF
jgi:LL-diaminopimelate aminotransferase